MNGKPGSSVLFRFVDAVVGNRQRHHQTIEGASRPDRGPPEWTKK
jgi:hypothetical protein